MLEPALQARRRAAVCGLGRIGRHHAKWYQALGCELVAYAVARPESLPRAEADCPGARGYLDWDRLLSEERPDLVSICTPAAAHYEPARTALVAGAAVLCEKPLCWADDGTAALAQAQELVSLAQRLGAVLAVNLQYAYAAEAYRALTGAGGAAHTCEVVLESRGKGAPREPDEVWMELGPHAVSLALGLLPGAAVLGETMRVAAEPRRVTVECKAARGGEVVDVRLETAQRAEGPLRRWCGLNGVRAEIAGRDNAAGVYATYLTIEGTEHELPDLMRTSIERFCAAAADTSEKLATSGALGVSNLEVQRRAAELLSARQEGRTDG